MDKLNRKEEIIRSGQWVLNHFSLLKPALTVMITCGVQGIKLDNTMQKLKMSNSKSSKLFQI